MPFAFLLGTEIILKLTRCLLSSVVYSREIELWWPQSHRATYVFCTYVKVNSGGGASTFSAYNRHNTGERLKTRGGWIAES
jgi:hypothetical protein